VHACAACIYLRTAEKLVRVRQPDRNDDATRRVSPATRRDLSFWREFYSSAFPSRVQDARGPRGTSQQHNTHISEHREVFYPWHPWHGRKVWVHTTLVKRGRAVAHCSLEDVQPFRVLEVPPWMLDVAACCKTRVAKSGLANVESLRELKALLHSAQRAQSDIVPADQHRYLLEAGGADVNVADLKGIHPTPVVCSSAAQAALDGFAVRCSTEDSAIADAVAAAALRQTPDGGRARGGAR
jgi:hypothetical protein